MKKITLFLAFLCISLFANAQVTCNQTFTASGQDDGPTVLIINAADLTCQGADAITALQLINSADNLNSGFCTTNGTSWYGFSLSVDGGAPVPVCDGEINGIDITGFTTLTITSQDNDSWSDGISITIDVEVTFTPTAAPLCDSTLTNPVNGAASASVDGILIWSAASGGATGYNLTVGTTSGGSETLATTDVGNVITYALGALTASTQYYLTIESYNVNGIANGCIEQTFTTYTPVSGDVCAIALPINCGDSTTGTTVGATSNGAPTGFCGTGTGAPGVWYNFTGNGDLVTASLCNSGFDTKIQVYEGSCVALTCVSGNDDACGLQSETTFVTAVGTEYYIYVYGYGSNTGAYQLDITCVTPPPIPVNDECANATDLTVNADLNCDIIAAGTIAGGTASAEPNASCGGNTNNDVWYTFTATSDFHIISLNNLVGSTTDMYMSIFEGTCGAFTEVLCSDPNTASVTGLTAGTQYTIRVYTWNNDPLANTTFDICVGTPPPSPVNDECSFAIPVSTNPDSSCTNFASGTISGATPSAEADECNGDFNSNPHDDVWFSFIATASTHLVSLPNSINQVDDTVFDNLYISVYEGTCGSLTNVSCTSNQESVLTGLTIGTTYFIRIYSQNSTGIINVTFDVCIGLGATIEINANCEDAAPFCANSGAIEFENISGGTFPDAPQEVVDNTCLGSAPNPAWFFIQVAEPGDMEFEIEQTTEPGGAGTGLDVDYALWGPFSNTNEVCTAFAFGDCNGDHDCTGFAIDCSYSAASVENATITNAQAGSYYLFLITNYDGDAGYISLTQTNSTDPTSGATDCTILCPEVTAIDATCGLDNGSIIITELEPSTSYTINFDYNGVAATPVTATSNAIGDLVISDLAAGDYTSIVTDAPECGSVDRDAIIIAAAAPIIDSLVAANNSICVGVDVVFVLTGSPNSIVTYDLNGDEDQIVEIGASGVVAVVVTAPTEDVTITLSLISQNGCEGDLTESVTTTVVNLMAELGDDFSFCESTPQDLTVTTNASASATYAWTLDGAPIVGAITDTITVSATGDYQVTIVDGMCNIIDVVSVDVTTIMTMDLGTDIAACSDVSTILTANSNIGASGITYSWTLDGDTISGETSQTLEVTTSGVYEVSGVSGGCNAAATVNVDITPIFTLSLTDLELCAGEDITLNATPVESVVAPTYLWNTGETSAVINPSEYGTYSVDVTVGQCTVSMSINVDELTGCVIPQGISPNNDGINDCFDMSSFEANKITVYNRYGAEVYEKNNYRNEWCGTTEDGNSGSELPTGTYYYILDLPTGEVMKGWVYINREN